MKTDAEIRQQGMQALIQALGLVDAERFLAAFGQGRFDYTEWRRASLQWNDSLDALADAANAYSDRIEADQQTV
ncbi:hypothetical protein F2Q65_14855 [Thiohalocapsa marina]|uniref:Uncharacterized protein n=1 Tax=Thiohalocapsa marina TaxID=424902 RepID=A0A5M8FG78_9GAMM|nr:hypothetical protein [Thiohalocapsa marina]KAA6183717.1 hypothetical protein F2Q65_14855 [Thiohalocapsa marina]